MRGRDLSVRGGSRLQSVEGQHREGVHEGFPAEPRTVSGGANGGAGRAGGEVVDAGIPQVGRARRTFVKRSEGERKEGWMRRSGPRVQSV